MASTQGFKVYVRSLKVKSYIATCGKKAIVAKLTLACTLA